MEIKELYKEIILDHGKNPRNFGKCNNFNNTYNYNFIYLFPLFFRVLFLF